MRDIPTALWLMLAAIAVPAHDLIPMARWLTIHLLLLGGVTHAILVWSQYFSYALLRSRATLQERRAQNMRLTLANIGAAIVFIGVPTDVWPLTVAGAALLISGVFWHGLSLYLRSRGSMPGRFGHTTRFYIASSAMLIIGATFGVLVAGGAGANLILAHTLINMLGWVGITVAGTVVTLWPTILRTRADANAAQGAARALPLLAVGVLTAATGAAAVWIPAIAIGLALYLAGLTIIAFSLWRSAWQAPPYSFAALSVGLALSWWAGIVATLLGHAVFAAVRGTGLLEISVFTRAAAPYLAAGFAAQIIIGALSYLIPVVIGGGPTPVRAGATAFDRLGPLRVTVTNVALGLLALPISGGARKTAFVLVAVSLASFLPIMFHAMRTQSRAKRSASPASTPIHRPPAEGRIVPEGNLPVGVRAGQAVAGLLTVIVAVTLAMSLFRLPC